MARGVGLYAAMAGLLAAAFMAARIFFYLSYADMYKAQSSGAVAGAFAQGLRFDLSTACLISAPFVLMFLMPEFSWARRARKALLGMMLLLHVFLIGYLFVDVIYFSFSQRHLTFELGGAWGETGAIVKVGFMEYLPQVAGLLLFLAMYAWAYARIARAWIEWPRGNSRIAAFAGQLMALVIVAVISIVGIRGGFQMRPMGVHTAFAGRDMQLGMLSLNGVYTTYHHFYSVLRGRGGAKFKTLSPEAQQQTLQEMVSGRTEQAREGYALFRRFPYAPNPALKNVVIFIMESWSTAYMGAYGATRSATPFFDSIAPQGLLMKNCLANAQRSMEGLPAIMGSIPPLGGMSVGLGGLYSQVGITSMAHALRQDGYSTMFIHGADRGTLGFDGLAGKLGFERHVAMEDLKRSDSEYDGVWGLYDEHVFSQADGLFRSMREPFYAVLFSLSSHTPYRIPSAAPRPFGLDEPKAQFLNAMSYSDRALGEYFKAAQGSPYFKDTIFLIAADHTEGSFKNPDIRKQYSIPCLLYAPGIIEPGVSDAVVSQVDLAPTLMDVLKSPSPFVTTGRSIFDTAGPRGALLPYGTMTVYVEGPYVLLTDFDGIEDLYELSSSMKITGQTRAEAKRMSEVAARRLGALYLAVKTNHLSPMR